jgi:hypothetical protein
MSEKYSEVSESIEERLGQQMYGQRFIVLGEQQ